MVFSIEVIEKKLKIDDAVGAVSVHGVVEVAGKPSSLDSGELMLVVESGLFNNGGAKQVEELKHSGALAYAVWAITLSWIVLFTLKKTIGLRVTKEVEEKGLEFQRNTEPSLIPERETEGSSSTDNSSEKEKRKKRILQKLLLIDALEKCSCCYIFPVISKVVIAELSEASK